MVTLRHSPGITGAFSYAGDTYPIEDGIIEVEDEDVAAAMVADSHKLSWESDRHKDESSASDAEETEANTSDEDTATETFRCGVNDCSRTVDSPEDTCWQHSE